VKHYLGIDPGLSGALAVIGPDGSHVWDTPVITVANGKKHRREYVLAAMRTLVWDAAPPPSGQQHGVGEVVAVIEAVSPMPKEGVVSAYRMGYGAGLWHGLLELLGVPFRIVHPATWKKAEGLTGKDKAYSRLEASRRFPGLELGRVKDHGRAEALLLADYARKLGW
jgi:crossover junction endodeoxyribonuclease RuvC